MKISYLLLSAALLFTSFAFTSYSSNSDESKYSKVYIQQIKKLISQRYKANFKKSKAHKMTKVEARQWLETIKKRKGKLMYAEIQNISNAIFKQKHQDIYLLQNIDCPQGRFTEALIIRVEETNRENMGFSCYLVTNAEEDEPEEYPCTYSYGEKSPPPLVGIASHEMDPWGMETNATSGCSQCVSESVTEGDCGDTCTNC